MKHFWFINNFFFLLMTFAVDSQSYYSINAPGVIKSNRKYSVLVTLHEASDSCSIRVGVEGPTFKDYKDVHLQPYESKIVEFFPKKLQEGNFFLKAEGLNGLSFRNETRVYSVYYEGPKIYIQTDKAIYKPQDLVKFRFVLLDEHTRPLQAEAPIRVEILDSAHNRVKEFKNVSLEHGIFSGQFQLSKYPVLGTWQVKVIIDGTYSYSNFKNFKILNYVLPKFSVYLKAPSNIVLADGLLKVAIYGKYTFDKYVEGNATIELWYNDQHQQTKQLDIQNLGFVDFDIKSIKLLDNVYGLDIKARLSEKYTGKTELEQQYINIRKQRYNLAIPNNEIEFENNKPYSLKAYVKHWTGAPVLDRKSAVSLQHGGKMYETFLDGTGAATFEFDYDPNDSFNIQFKDTKEVLPNIYTSQDLMLNSREYYCRLKLVDKNLKLGKPVLIEVSSIVSIPYLMYTVMGHASLVRNEYIQVPPNQKSHIISIQPSIEMIPQSFLYVYYVHKGNLRYEEMTLNFPFEFENQVSVSTPKQVKPGENVTITVSAQPNSYVGILAVDLGVFLLDHTYDLDKDQILEDLYEEKSYTSIGWAEYPGIVSGLITMTNAHYPFNTLPPPPSAKAYVPNILRFRQKFPETWIFDNFLINDTLTPLTLQIPDAITTWRITAFSNNHITGFGIVSKPTDITTIQTFFITLNLPFSVKRGEIFTVPVTVFNYSNQTLDTEVILYNNDKEFYFMESKLQAVEKSDDDQEQIKQISIASEKGKIVKFLIYPVKAGEITLKVTATNSLYSDAVLQKLKVESEGVPKQQNLATFLSIPAGEKITSVLKIEQPVDKVPESDYFTFSVGGHYLVPTVENFDELTERPTGSGEQNMINFAPSVLVLQYLNLNGKLSREKKLVENLLSSIEVGYQQQLSYRHNEGGYSVFGMDTDEEPSTWLTAYVVRYFIKSSQFLHIESNIIEMDLKYLAAQQKPTGEFPFTGYLLNPNHGNNYGLTAFVLLAFLEDDKYAGQYQKTIQNGIEFLNANIDNVDDVKALCLMTAVLKRAKQQNADKLIDQLKSYGKEENGLKWWSGNDQNPANDIEITANAALALLDTPGDHTSILKWLIKQRNANGGFISCYDTVAGMEALVKFSEIYTNLNKVNLKIFYRAKDELGNEVAANEFQIDSYNILNFQKHELPNATHSVTFEMQGSGAALVQLSQQYNVVNKHEFQHFNIETKSYVKNAEEYDLKVCFSAALGTEMIMLEINLPSGFRSDAEKSLPLKENALVLKVETKNSESVVVLYLDKLSANMKHCLKIPVDKVNEILMPKPTAIIISVRRVNFTITGHGYSWLLSSQYNVKTDEELKYFVMEIKPDVITAEELDLLICFTYQALKGINNNTNMVIMEANLPSGFKTEAEVSKHLWQNNFLQRVETKNDETTMILYFDKLSTDVKHCITIEAFSANEVEIRKPASINMYDYYNTDRLNTQFYTI